MGKAEQGDPAPFFTLIKAFVGTSTARLLMNGKEIRYLEGKTDINKESWKGVSTVVHCEHLPAAAAGSDQCWCVDDTIPQKPSAPGMQIRLPGYQG